jgi:ferrochelatase
VPFRAPKSAKIYQELWTKDGSPLLIHGKSVTQKLQEKLAQKADVFFAMRYQNPSIDSVLEEIRKKNYAKIIVIPLYPQYASSSTGSTLEKVMQIVSKWWVIPEITMVSQYYDEAGYLDAFAERGKKHVADPDSNRDYEHVLFSYHGLPVRQVDKVYENGPCSDHHCEDHIDEENAFCYKAACYETTRQIALRLNIPKDKYTVAFQSRLDKNWLEPFSDKVVAELAEKGIKTLLVFSPAFTADCLETTIEIGSEYKEIFEKHGGQHLQLVESLNDHPLWIDTLEKMVIERL